MLLICTQLRVHSGERGDKDAVQLPVGSCKGANRSATLADRAYSEGLRELFSFRFGGRLC